MPVSEYDQIPVVQNLTKKIEEDNDNPDLYYERGVAYYQLGNQQSALSDVVKALQLDSTNAGYYELLGDIYFARKEYTRAINALQKGNRIAPEDMDIIMQLGQYHLMMGNHQESIKYLDEALKKNIFNAEAYFFKGILFKEIGDTAKSISNFQTAVEQDPQYYEAYMQLGLLHSKLKNKLALDYFNNALKIDSSSYEAKYAIAMYYQETKQYGTALELYRKFILEFPQDKDAYYNSGVIYFDMDSMDKAIRSFEQTMSVAPDYDYGYFMRGYSAEVLGDGYYKEGKCAKGAKDDKSRELCSKAIEEFKTAKYFYRQTLNLNPDHKLATEGFERMQPY